MKKHIFHFLQHTNPAPPETAAAAVTANTAPDNQKSTVNSAFTDACTDMVYAPCCGRLLPLAALGDGIFSEGCIGEGAAIEPDDGSFYAPFDCTVTMIFDTRHALILHSPKDTELILHIGLDTVQLGGRPFEILVQEGQTVRRGELLMRADLDSIRQSGRRTVSPVIITAAGGAESVIPLTKGPVQTGDPILRITYRPQI